MKTRLSFRDGTLEIRDLDRTAADELGVGVSWDDRAHMHRAPGSAYAPLLRALVAAGIEFEDEVRKYASPELALRSEKKPRSYQDEAIRAWLAAKGRGVVVLPTGAGKSHVAVMAIALKNRSTLIVAPTLDLVRQWHGTLEEAFGVEVGMIGGGEYDLKALTVTTYDSAYLHMDRLGNQFGLIVFDEVHHLPGESYALTAKMCIAPFRLGLTATPERGDGREALLDELVGEEVYRKNITELSGTWLSDYETQRIVVDLTEEERGEYDDCRAIYVAFIRSSGIQMSSPSGFRDFIMRASRSEQGRRALTAYRRQRALALAAGEKRRELTRLLHLHRRDRAIIFTQDNQTAYDVSREHLLPIITHQTKLAERKAVLDGLSSGRFNAIVTSKVLNEGVDVKVANVAIVLSGSGSVMEHVQRLGRILRPAEGKQAILYEIISKGTSESKTSDRRREHDAYRKSRSNWRRR